MADPVELMLSDLQSKYAQMEVSETYLRLYVEDGRFGRIFASLHERLSAHFEGINGRAKTTRHYWADPSRELLSLMEEVPEVLYVLKQAGIEVTFSPDYKAALDRCQPWLTNSGGSTVPEDFQPISIIKFSPVFARPDTSVMLKKKATGQPLRMIGEGSYATVFSFEDPDYGIRFALKRAKKGLNERDLHRFREEFRILKSLSFPYLVEVYQYDEDRNEYKMEFCDDTLRSYISKTNSVLKLGARKRIALQFLYGINYLHTKGYLHRDISLQNVLVKVFGDGAVLMKLSDFGLVKDTSSDFTRTQTEMRGTIRDPMLVLFKNYSVLNEIYAIGWILSYIFTGREALMSDTHAIGRIIRKCTDQDLGQRYPDVPSIIADVERLIPPTTAAGAPA